MKVNDNDNDNAIPLIYQPILMSDSVRREKAGAELCQAQHSLSLDLDTN